MNETEKLKMVLEMLKFCPCCHVVYFGETRCEPCNRTYYNGYIELVPLPLTQEDKK